MSRQPVTKWAQRSDKVLITIELPSAKDVKLALRPDGQFHFSAATGADNVPYEIGFDLYDRINVDESKVAVGFSKVCYILKKAEEKWWSRLLRQGGKPPLFLKDDWDKWVDEDDQLEKEFEDLGFGELEFSKLLNMGSVKDGETGEVKTAKEPPAANEFEDGSEAKECMSKVERKFHDLGFDRLGVDWQEMNTYQKKYLNMKYGAKQRAMFVDDDDDDDDAEEVAADKNEVEDSQLGPIEILKLLMSMQLSREMMNVLVDDD